MSHQTESPTQESALWSFLTKVLIPLLVAIGGLGSFLTFGIYLCNNGYMCSQPPPSASFTISPTTNGIPLKINISNTSTGTIERYIWDFGDGQSSRDANLNQWTYWTAGEYTLRLIVEGLRTSDEYSIKITGTTDGARSAIDPDAPPLAEEEVSQFNVSSSPVTKFTEYFKQVEQHRYDETWMLLTDNWKSRFNAQGFESYRDWVNNISRVVIQNSFIVCENENYAVILADISYYTSADSTTAYTQDNRYFRLRADTTRNTWLLDDAGENPRTCEFSTVADSSLPTLPPPTATVAPTFTPIPINADPVFSSVSFCLEEPTLASAYACANPVNQLPSGITRFYYSRSFQGIPIGTLIYSRWYREGVFIVDLERTITYEGKWFTNTGYQYSWIQEVSGQFELIDGLYTVEIFIGGMSSAADQPDQQGSVLIGN